MSARVPTRRYSAASVVLVVAGIVIMANLLASALLPDADGVLDQAERACSAAPPARRAECMRELLLPPPPATP